MTGVGRSKLTRGRPRSTLPLVSSPAPRIPPRVLAEVLIANKYTCCICVQARRPTKVHSIVGDPTNTKLNNLAVICTGCLERVVREGATGKRFGEEGLRHFKKRWEEVCAVNADIFEDEPVFVSNRTIDVKAKDCGATYPIDLERGHLLLASVEADVPVTVLLVPERTGTGKALWRSTISGRRRYRTSPRPAGCSSSGSRTTAIRVPSPKCPSSSGPTKGNGIATGSLNARRDESS